MRRAPPLVLVSVSVAFALALTMVLQPWPSVMAVQFSKVHYIQRYRNNLLFRGDEPRNDSVEYADCGIGTPMWDCFGWDELKDFMTSRVYFEGSAGFLPAAYRMVDVSMIGNQSEPEEVQDLKIEHAFFDKFPERGVLEHWELFGDTSDPADMDEEKRKELALSLGDWQADKLVERVPQIRKWLENGIGDEEAQGGAAMPTVVYVHCEHGMDRTGELAGSYVLHYLRQTFKQVCEYNDAMGSRPMQPWNKRSLQWYCLYLQYTGRGGAPGDDCGIASLAASAANPTTAPTPPFEEPPV